MKLLMSYLRPYRWLLALALGLAAMNQIFSMFDPLIFGKLFDKFVTHPHDGGRTKSVFLWGVLGYLGMLMGVARVSRMAKAFHDYFGNVIVQ